MVLQRAGVARYAQGPNMRSMGLSNYDKNDADIFSDQHEYLPEVCTFHLRVQDLVYGG
jgi:hypothetical protein